MRVIVRAREKKKERESKNERERGRAITDVSVQKRANETSLLQLEFVQSG